MSIPAVIPQRGLLYVIVTVEVLNNPQAVRFSKGVLRT